MKTASLLSAALFVLAVPVFAAPTFTPGNHPSPDEENVLFNQNDVGNPIFGETNQSNLIIRFDSTTDLLLAPSQGQARVEADDGAINNISIDVPDGFYMDLIINPFLQPQNSGGPAEVTVLTDAGLFNWAYPDGLGNGNNFLTILVQPGEKILKTTIDSLYGFDNLEGFGDLRHPRISGASLFDRNGDDPPIVPEPGTVTLLGCAIMPMLGRLRRR